MNGQDFLRIAQKVFVPIFDVHGFQMDAPLISGKLYRANFSSLGNIISISYEPVDNALHVMIFSKIFRVNP